MANRWLPSFALIVAVATVSVFSLGAGSASAEETQVYRTAFGTLGSGKGQLSSPHALATDSAGNVWIADTENSRIEEFNAKGE
ncbi:MAG TPA: hypothetical protein VFJ61_00345, partial [Solirubrobacterales bacterium]|nr:hypothetical protein [Solirubrobacterales bacterium]